MLDSDEKLFGGFGRIDHNADFFSYVRKFTWDKSLASHVTCPILFPSVSQLNLSLQEGFYDNRPRSFMVYTPSRTVVVYRQVEDDVKPVKG